MSNFRTWYQRQPVALRTLITINVMIYVAWMLLFSHLGPSYRFFYEHLALNPALPGVLLEAWQLVTYNFLHLGFGFGGLLHIGFNMLWLYWIGKEYEEMHGPHQLLALYVIGGVGGGLLSVLWYAAAPGAPIIYGASASVLGLLTAVAILYPYKQIRLLFIGTVKLLYVVLAFLAIDVLLAASSNTAVLAHLGGAGAGFLFARAERGGVDLTSWARIFFASSRSQGSGRRGRSAQSSGSGSGGGVLGGLFGSDDSSSSSGSSRRGSRAPGRHRTPREERDRKKAEQHARDAEVNRILDKISAEGYEALSEDEKRVLEDASRQ